jgi:hypothetical protein
MRLITLTLCAATFVALSLPASADVGLADWCVDVNGDTSTVCNGGTSPGGNATVNLTGFDTSLEPGSNTLGKIVVTLGTGVQGVGVYMDYDVDNASLGFDQDSAAAHGTPSGTQSYDLDTPPNPFFDFSSPTMTPLSDSNNVGTFSTSPAPCCDVSWALQEFGFVDPTLYSGITITFTVSTVAPTSGFYLSQTNGDTRDSIYLSDTFTLNPLGRGAGPTPEPMSVVLFATFILGALFLRRRSSMNGA